MRLRLHREASEELDAAARWYEEQGRGLGDDLLGEVDRALTALTESPEAWPILRRKSALRRFLLSRFPYSVIYDFVGGEVRVFAVAHSKRRPGYWRKRRFR